MRDYESVPGSDRTPGLIYLILALLIYYCLFSSLNGAKGYFPNTRQDHAVLWALTKILKILIFALSVLFISNRLRNQGQYMPLCGPLISLASSLALATIRIFDDTILLFIQAAESLGEALTASFVVHHIREAARKDASYLANSTFWRIGTTAGGLLSSLLSGHLFELIPNVYVWILCVIRVVILAMIAYHVIVRCSHFGKQTEPDSRLRSSVDETCVPANTFNLDSLLGVFVYSLFYILIFSPILLASCSGSPRTGLEYYAVRGNFAMALLAIFLILKYVRHRSCEHELIISLQTLQIAAAFGTALIASLWILFLLLGNLVGLTILGALYGFFSMATYQFCEMLVGTSGRRDCRGKQIIRYMGLTRFGQFFGITGSLLLLEEHGRIALAVFVIIQILGITTVSSRKRKAINRKGGNNNGRFAESRQAHFRGRHARRRQDDVLPRARRVAGAS